MSVITQDHVDKWFNESKKEVIYVFNKNLVLSAKLPSGFIISENTTSSNTGHEDYCQGYDIAVSKIKAKIWELETYRLHTELKAMDRK